MGVVVLRGRFRDDRMALAVALPPDPMLLLVACSPPSRPLRLLAWSEEGEAEAGEEDEWGSSKCGCCRGGTTGRGDWRSSWMRRSRAARVSSRLRLKATAALWLPWLHGDAAVA